MHARRNLFILRVVVLGKCIKYLRIFHALKRGFQMYILFLDMQLVNIYRLENGIDKQFKFRLILLHSYLHKRLWKRHEHVFYCQLWIN